MFENWILGCQDIHWSQFEPQLHPYAKQKLLGRFTAEVAHVSNEKSARTRKKSSPMRKSAAVDEVVRETLDQAHHKARGVTGLRRVLARSSWAKCKPCWSGKTITPRPSSAPAAAISTLTWSASVRSAADRLERSLT